MRTDWYLTTTSYFSWILVCFWMTATSTVECLEERCFTVWKVLFWLNLLWRSVFSLDLPRACFLWDSKTWHLLSIIKTKSWKKLLDPNAYYSNYPMSSSGSIIIALVFSKYLVAFVCVSTFPKLLKLWEILFISFFQWFPS